MKKFLFVIICLSPTFLFAQTNPAITKWILNTNGKTGYKGILSNVQKVQYSDSNVYVTCTCIPGYDIGPWAGNPNVAANQNFLFKITLNPRENKGQLTRLGGGHTGVWTNGVSIFNATDARSYNNENVWHQDAYLNEGPSFDDCLGHPQQNGEYHHHVNPKCLYDDHNKTNHSPIIGYAFDGFPVYGSYAYEDPDTVSKIIRMTSGYRLRNITKRSTMPDGNPAPKSGPDVSTQYPLGKYIEDFEYVSGLGTLDRNNGRFCKTPEYPNGIYAYFVTIDSNYTPTYPYTIGENYYGIVQSGNTGMGSGHNNITETVKTYTLSNLENNGNESRFKLFPNPNKDGILNFNSETSDFGNFTINILNLEGKELLKIKPSSSQNFINLTTIAAGVYLVKIESRGEVWLEKLVISE